MLIISLIKIGCKMTSLIHICVVSLVCVFVHGDIPDHTCFTPDPIRSLDETENGAWIGSYIGYVNNTSDLNTTFGRVVDTGSGDNLIPGIKGIVPSINYADKRSVVFQYLSVNPGSHRVGAFFCNSVHLEDDPSYIPSIILAKGAYTKPEKRTQTVSFGETVTINMNLVDGNVTDLRWTLNENITESWSGMVTVTIENVTKADAGIYECYLNNRRNESRHAIMRLIVRGCSAARWGPDCQNLCPTCYNGGVCDDVTGLCICPPGFKTTDCSFGCGNNNWGRDCSLVCSTRSPGCSGKLACVPDPLGCSCMAGYGGLNCKKGCETMGKYGSSCSEECHCADGVACDPSSGCPNGPCEDGYSGKNCQVPDTCPDGRYGELCKYYCHCEDDGPCNRTTGSCGERECRHLWIGNDCQLDGRTNISLIIPESNIGASVSITCIVRGNPIPNNEDIHVLKNDDTHLEGGVSTLTQPNYTRTVVYSNENVAKGDVFKCQVSSSVAGDAHVEKNVTIYDPPELTTVPQVNASDPTVTVTWDQWTDSDGNGDGPVIGYQVCYLRTGGSWKCIENALNLTASFDIDRDDEFQRGLEYNFAVRAIRPGKLGVGTRSPPTSVTIPCLSPEVAPSNVTVLSLGISDIQVQWQLIDTQHWRCDSLDSYEVEYKKSESGSLLQIQTVTNTATLATISNLEICTSYQIQVSATNSGGLGPSSDIVIVATDTQEPGAIALSDSGVIPSANSLTLNWNIPSNPECITSFNVDYTLINLDQCNTSVTTTESQQFSATETEGVLSNLLSHSLYRLSLYAVYGYETTDSVVTEATTLASIPTGKPLAVSNQDPQETELSFTWQPPDCGKRNGLITKYKSRLKNSTSIIDTKQTSELSVTFSSLLPCTKYRFQVKALNGELVGPWSDVLPVQTATQEPDRVQDVTITRASRSLLVKWEAPATQACEVDFYKLEYQLQNLGMCDENLGSVEGPLYTTNTSIEIGNLEVFSRYSVTIYAVIGQEGGTHNIEGPGRTLNKRTNEEEPLAGPEDIQAIISQNATNDTPGEIEISFGSVPCLQKRGDVLNYMVQVIDGDGDVLGNNTMTAGTSPATITGGFPCESVTPQVAACTSTGCGVFASGSTITMNPAAPGKVSVDVNEPKAKKLSLSWSAPEVDYCPIVEYKIEYRLVQLDQCRNQFNEFEVNFVNYTDRQYTLSNLIPFSTYDVVVSAGVDGLNGNTIFTPGLTDVGSTTSSDATAPPDNIIHHKTENARSLNFTWEEIPCGHRRGAIVKYNYTLKHNSSIVKQTAIRPRTVMIRNLIPCTTYTFIVSGRGRGGRQGPDSDSIEARTNAEVPESVENIVVQGSTLVWDRPPPLTCDILSYHINASLIERDKCQQVNRNDNFTVEDAELNLLLLEPYSTYRVTITAETDAGLGQETTHKFVTPQKVPERGPKEVNIIAVSATEASFAWSEIECGYRRGLITGYKFSLQKADGQELITNFTTRELQCEVDDLKPFTEYIFSVKGFNSKGDGKSKELHITTDESIPSDVRNIKILNTDTESFQIEWSRPEPPNGIVIRYQINYTVIDGLENNPQSAEYDVSDKEREKIDFNNTIGNLHPNSNYSVQAAALTSVGIGPWSEVLYVFTATSEPGPVQTLSVVYANETELYMTWKPPLYPNGVITNYSIQYRILKKHFELDAEIQLEWIQTHSVGVNLTCLLSSLEPATTYEIVVFANTSAGSGEQSNTNGTTLTPSVDKDSHPTLSVMSKTDTTITVKLEPIPNFIYVKQYVILVDKEAGAKRRNADDREYGKYEDSPNKYITASFPRDDVPVEGFVVGDGEEYGDYLNAPLVKGDTYGLSFAVRNGDKIQTTGLKPEYVEAGKPIPHTPKKNTSVALIIGLLMLFVVAAIGLAMVVTLKRRRGGIRAKPMFPMSHIANETRLSNAPSEDTLADTVNGKQPPITPKPANLKAARIHRPVKVEHLAAYVKKKRAHQNEGFLNDFESLPDQQMHSWDVAKKSENKTKNRYGNIVAYDHCRVVLDPVPGDPHSDYINACYIDGYKQKNAYIATQGPNTACVQDIWRMVWQEGCSVIVMVTNLSEGGKTKCEKYWPDNTQTYASIDVKTISEEDYPQYTVRTFKITKNDEGSREVKQFHFTVWPDMGVPEFANDILRFIDVVKENSSEQIGPTVVHCSAGVGRTGTLIAISEMLDMARDEEKINVFNFVRQMRAHRVKMVQTADQYFFIFDALLEAVVCGPTSTKPADMNSFYNSLLTTNPLTKRSYILEQYNALEAMSVVTTEENTKGGKLPDNISKNRFPEQVPIDGSRPYLMTLSSETSNNYINASFLQGYRGKDMYIASQMPMPNTIADFWCMVYDYKSKLILMLNEVANLDKTYGKYWPDSGSVQHGPMSIEHVSTEKSTTAICRIFTLTNTLRMKEESRQIKQYQYLGWRSSKTPASVESVLEFLKLLDGEGSETTDTPIIVHCINGIERCGLFCTIHSVFQRLQQENIVDVFHTIRKLRRSRANMVAPVSQFEFCFTTVRCYLDAFEIYSNYK